MSAKYLLIMFCAGGLGALSRFGLSGLINQAAGGRFPLGTAAVNLAGCFLFGLVSALGARQGWPEPVRLVILAGFLGAFTTFSSFIFDTFMVGQFRWSWSAMNVIGQLVLGFMLLLLGMRVAKLLG